MRTNEEYLGLLQETVDYYKTAPIERRALDGSRCRYLAESGNMCAVGRCLLEPEKAIEGAGADAVAYDDALKEQYRGFDVDFWSQLQLLHDDNSCWTETGLSEIGEKEVEHLKKEIYSGIYEN